MGSGGREHALAWKIARSPRVNRIYCAPGNGGTATIATNVDIAATDIDGLVSFASSGSIGLTVVGPELPLVAGLVDLFEEAGLPVFGPRRNAAMLEGSKAFAKTFMAEHNIPTAAFERFDDPESASAYLASVDGQVVVKADGLAAGKGVYVCDSDEEARRAVHEIMVDRRFGDAGARIIIEERLEGTELSMLCFTDGKSVVPMVSARDYKRVGDGDTGPNTGGMGAVSPNLDYDETLEQRCLEEICLPTVRGMEAAGRSFSGVLYVGIMLTADGPKVLEYNARFGDPETQVVLPRLESDLVGILEAVVAGQLDRVPVEWSSNAAATVVLASGGYPGPYKKGKPISGLDTVQKSTVFHAGTEVDGSTCRTNGGRVLAVTATAGTANAALQIAYADAAAITFKGSFYRSDIGA